MICEATPNLFCEDFRTPAANPTIAINQCLPVPALQIRTCPKCSTRCQPMHDCTPLSAKAMECHTCSILCEPMHGRTHLLGTAT